MKLNYFQEKAIELLACSALKEKFYWTGGTLLACHYLGHRQSWDLDFFTDQKFNFEEINQWVGEFKKGADFSSVSYQKIFDRYEFLFKNKSEFRIEFVYYNHEKKTLKKRKKLRGIYIDSLEDIAANKVMAFFDRNEPKDLFDLYFLLNRKHFTVSGLLSLAKRKFGLEMTKSSFFSEAFRKLPLLKTLKPLMIEKSNSSKEALLKRIAVFFESESHGYLESVLK